MTEQPANPEPAYPNSDSMLSRKFGKEVANYFSGSPLNRVGFLREDHQFLSQALHHPSTSFLACNNLQPLHEKAKHKVGGKLTFLKYDDVKTVVGEDRYQNPEKDVIARYNSENYIPQMVFLGIDERVKDGLSYQGKNRYTGAPYFAVDVTPKASMKETCEELIKKLQQRGLEFEQGRVMDIDASHGRSLTAQIPGIYPKLTSYSRHLRRVSRSPRLERPQPLLRRLRQHNHQRQRRLQTRLPTLRPRERDFPARTSSLRHPRPHL